MRGQDGPGAIARFGSRRNLLTCDLASGEARQGKCIACVRRSGGRHARTGTLTGALRLSCTRTEGGHILRRELRPRAVNFPEDRP
jgi:hypothetical protein